MWPAYIESATAIPCKLRCELLSETRLVSGNQHNSWNSMTQMCETAIPK